MADSFGERLRKLRKNAGLTQADIADRLNKSASAVRMWELGVNEPGIVNLVQLSVMFDCSLDYLLCRDNYLGDTGAVRTNLPVYRLTTYGPEAPPDQYRSIPSDYLSGGDTYFMLLNDSSMMEPLLPLGAFVLIKRQESCLDRQVVFVRLGERYLLRKLVFCNGGMLLYGALNEAAAYYVESDDPTFELIGVATEFRKTI